MQHYAQNTIVYLEKTLPNPTNGYSDGADTTGQRGSRGWQQHKRYDLGRRTIRSKNQFLQMIASPFSCFGKLRFLLSFAVLSLTMLLDKVSDMFVLRHFVLFLLFFEFDPPIRNFNFFSNVPEVVRLNVLAQVCR